MSVHQEVYLMFAREVEPLVKAKYPGIQRAQFNQVNLDLLNSTNQILFFAGAGEALVSLAPGGEGQV